MTVVKSPWARDIPFRGTNGKQFAPAQFQNPDEWLYISNIQRFGKIREEDMLSEERYGFEVKRGFLPHGIYHANPDYYQKYDGVWNMTSIRGLPLMLTKNHFMNCTDPWKDQVEIWD